MKHIPILLFLFLTIEITCQKLDFKNINFDKADNIAKLYKGNNLKNLPLLTYKLTSKLDTDVEKFRAIYIWISKNIKGDYYMHKSVTKNRKKLKNDSISYLKWNKKYSKKVFRSLLKNKKTMCTGYAYLLKTMCKIANITCVIVDGYGRNTSANIGKLSIPNHSWNAVKLNNKWYLVDATWASGYTDLAKNSFIFDYNDGYFLTAPTLFVKNHFPLDKKWTLLKNKTSKEFVIAPLIYGEIYKHHITPMQPKKMENNVSLNEEIKFELHAKKNIDLDKIEIQIGENLYIKKTKPSSVTRIKESIFIDYKFKTNGFYDVHILYKDNVIITYTFNVTK